MSSTTERFIRLYEDLVGRGEPARQVQAPPIPSRSSARQAGMARCRKQQNLLKYIRDVRHALQHPKHRSEGHAVLISELFLEEVASLLNHFQNPVRAGSLGVPRKQIRTAQLSDRLGDLADDMKSGRFQPCPHRGRGRCRGRRVQRGGSLRLPLVRKREDRRAQHARARGPSPLPTGRQSHGNLQVRRPPGSFGRPGRHVPGAASPRPRAWARYSSRRPERAPNSLQRLITPWDVLGGAAE